MCSLTLWLMKMMRKTICRTSSSSSSSNYGKPCPDLKMCFTLFLLSQNIILKIIKLANIPHYGGGVCLAAQAASSNVYILRTCARVVLVVELAGHVWRETMDREDTKTWRRQCPGDTAAVNVTTVLVCIVCVCVSCHCALDPLCRCPRATI